MRTEQTEIIICPLCRKEIHRNYAAPIGSRASIPSSATPEQASAMLTEMMFAAEKLHQEIVQRAEDACVEHMRTRHARRFRLWQRYKRNWLLTRRWPWSRFAHEQFEFPA